MTDSLIRRLEVAAGRGQELVMLDGPAPEHLSWGALHEDARRMAACLQVRGVAPGDRVALLGSTSRGMLTAIQASWLAGAAVIVPPLRTRLESDEEFRSRTQARMSQGEAAVVVCDPDLVAVSSGPSLPEPVTFPELSAAAAGISDAAFERPPEDAERTTILQFTSGSTADPKGVVIPERCLLANLDALVARDPFAIPGDTIMSWLPLYHDMGLVAITALAMTTGIRLVNAPPARFIASPGSWMQWMEAFDGTWTLGPNFSLAVAARFLRGGGKVDLRACRRVGSGSEPVDPAVMFGLAEAGADHGLDPTGLFAAYGMAEATVVVSFPAPGAGFTTDVVDGELLETERRAEPCPPDDASARLIARCGPPVEGMEVRIVDPEMGSLLEDRTAGEIELRGPSVVPGYFRRPDATAQAFREEGWLKTGDLGYFAEGDLVVCGRIKDLLIVGGRNIFPEDVERSVQKVDGVRPGNVIAFGIERGRKGDAMVVVAELKGDDAEATRREILRAVREAVGVRPDDVVLLAPGALPKTSSGKLRRSECRARYQAGELEQL